MIFMSKVLVISPHPDDETFGCGGTLLKHRVNGDLLFWLIMTKMMPEVGYSEEQMRTRQSEITSVASAYQFEKVFPLDFATTTLDTIAQSKLISAITTVVDQVCPEVVYLPNCSDVHSDHRVTFAAAISSIKTFRTPYIKKVFMYEVLSETEFAPPFQSSIFLPNSFSDISDYLEKKIEIMKLYKSELKEHPFPRSEVNLRALAIFRGATATVTSAEAFMICKEIW